MNKEVMSMSMRLRKSMIFGSIKSKISDILEFPADLLSSLPRITLLGTDTLVIENHKGVIEYNDSKVRLNTGCGVVSVSGIEMELNHLSSDDILIKGRIINIEMTQNGG